MYIQMELKAKVHNFCSIEKYTKDFLFKRFVIILSNKRKINLVFKNYTINPISSDEFLFYNGYGSDIETYSLNEKELNKYKFSQDDLYPELLSNMIKIDEIVFKFKRLKLNIELLSVIFYNINSDEYRVSDKVIKKYNSINNY